jgi:hypothetical protein
MPIKIEITGEHIGDVDLALKALNRPDPRVMPLDDLIAITRQRFDEAGFVVAVMQRGPTPATENQPTPAEAEAIVDKIEKKLAKKTTTAKKPTDAARSAEADKTFVVDEMVQRFGDPRQKLKAKAFIDKVTGRHGGVRLSLLDADLFPDIRSEMETEFNIPTKTANGNGAGGVHAG